MTKERQGIIEERIPTQEKLEAIKAEARRQAESLIFSSEQSKHLPHEIRLYATELLTHFLIGVLTIKDVSNDVTYRDFPLIRLTDNEVGEFIAKYNILGNMIVLDIATIIDCAWKILEGQALRHPFTFTTFYELAGVEEAAHALFFNKKKSRTSRGIELNITDSEDTAYDKLQASDDEFKGLKWQLEYARRILKDQELVKYLEAEVARYRMLRSKSKLRATSGDKWLTKYINWTKR